MNIDLRLGDCLEVLRTIADNSVDSVVVDPPYHLTSTKGDKKGFMGKDWDGGDIAFRTDVWSECLRVLKPGGHLLSFSHSRTYHRMAVAIEDAGFEIRDSIMWIYGSGFPKSHNIGKAIDKIQGNEREVIGDYETSIPQITPWKDVDRFESKNQQTKGSSDYEGWGTALKPAHEPICMARKPLSEKSIAENVLKWGTGGINIDGSRIEYKDGIENEFSESYLRSGHSKSEGDDLIFNISGNKREGVYVNQEGRFPANIIFDEEAGKLLDEQSGPTSQGHWSKTKTTGFGEFGNGSSTYEGVGPKDKNKDKQGASRFFYCPKVSKKERNAGLDDFEEKESVLPGRNTFDENGNRLRVDGSIIPPLVSKNHHPTVKPIKLMEYLIKLVTPKGGVVMDCFMGSGSTGIAARNLGFRFLGIEKEQEYFDIAKQRILP
jgi:site-specific DNA-methyltransferase (adenine-specific)